MREESDVVAVRPSVLAKRRCGRLRLRVVCGRLFVCALRQIVETDVQGLLDNTLYVVPRRYRGRVSSDYVDWLDKPIRIRRDCEFQVRSDYSDEFLNRIRVDGVRDTEL